MNTTKLFQRDFTLMIIGQIISLFGNAILRFALSLYVLDLTGSAAVFGGILALSMIPTILCAPLGGVAADRLPRQRIMMALDFFTAGLIFCAILALSLGGGLAAVTLLLLLLSAIQALYQPSVLSSIPLLCPPDQLMAANGVAVQVQALASLLGPILGGMLYGWFGLFPILAVSASCFFASAVLELFLRIPFHKPKATRPPLAQIGDDLGQAVRFLRRDRPDLLGFLLLLAALNLFLSSLYTVGLPYLIKTYLGLSAQHYGFAEAALGLGSILGGLLSGLAGKRIPFRRAHWFLLGTTLLLFPMVLALALPVSALLSYGLILISVLLGMAFAVLFNVAAQTFLQKETPVPLLGKVSSFVSAICVCAMPLGQALYGLLFEGFSARPWPVVVFAMLASLAVTLLAGRSLGRLRKNPENSDKTPNGAAAV